MTTKSVTKLENSNYDKTQNLNCEEKNSTKILKKI